MVAIQPILEGHEIFNTYGQMANWQLIHMYGFAEAYPNNTNDTADIQMVTVRDAALQGASAHSSLYSSDSSHPAGVVSSLHHFIGTKDETEKLLLHERWDFLCEREMVGEEGAFVIGCEEVLTEEELAATLKVQG